MSSDDDIPVLRDAVARRQKTGLSAGQIEELCESLTAETWLLIEENIAAALRETEAILRSRITDRLGDDLPALIEKTVRERLGSSTD